MEGFTGCYLVVLGHYGAVLVGSRWYWVSIELYWLVFGDIGSVRGRYWLIYDIPQNTKLFIFMFMLTTCQNAVP